MSHSFTVLSSEPEEISLQSEEKAAVFTQLECPVSENINFRSATFQSLIDLSSDEVSKCSPSFEKFTERTVAL